MRQRKQGEKEGEVRGRKEEGRQDERKGGQRLTLGSRCLHSPLRITVSMSVQPAQRDYVQKMGLEAWEGWMTVFVAYTSLVSSP